MTPTILGVVTIGILPTIIWALFFEQEHRKHPQPFHAIIYALIVGGLTTVFVLVLQVALNDQFMLYGISLKDPRAITIFAAVEEVLKFLAVFVLIHPNKHFKEPLDAMIFMIIAGLGFAAVENIATLLNHGGELASVLGSGRAFEITILRFMGATLLHALVGAVIGYHWAIGLIRKSSLTLHILTGIIIATLLHAVFNYLIITTGPASWAIAFLATLAFFVLTDFEELKAVD